MRTIWAQLETERRLYLVDGECNFVVPVKQYIDYLAALEKSPNTLESYCRHLRYYFTFLVQAQRSWRDVGPDDLVEFIQWLRNPARQVGVSVLRAQSPLTERSVNTIVTAVGSFYRYHIQRGEKLRSPVVYEQFPERFSGFRRFLVHTSRGKGLRRTIKLKEPKKRVKTIKDDAFRHYLAAVNNYQFRCLLLLLREGGLRIGEALGLLIQDVEFHRNGVWIRRRNTLENGALAKSMQEGEERFVDLTPQLMALLDDLIMKHSFDTDHLFVVLKKDAKDKWGNRTYGRPLDRTAAKALFRHYSQKCGVYLHAHMLRHSHATELIRAGWDASYVQRRIGHKQVQTTINTYVHLDEDDLAKKWKEYQEAKSRGKGQEATES